jgi:glutathione synthase/RimK-type ligase-like ATP-grasp enzyme
MVLVFATCADRPLIAPDDEPLAAALGARGVTVIPVAWTEIDRHAGIDAPPVLLRSTWDYHRVPEVFTTWLDEVGGSGRIMWNDASVARSNMDKLYLQRCEGRRIAIPPTEWLDGVDAAAIRETLIARGWERAVLKPRIAATAYGTFLVTPQSALSDRELEPVRASGGLLQKYVPEIETHGEVSVVYCDGIFSHAVIKRAAPGDFRVQSDFGGSAAPFTPSRDLLAFAQQALATVPGRCLYARVDVVETARGPLLMELELIEPELFFLIVPAAAETFADAIVKHLLP